MPDETLRDFAGRVRAEAETLAAGFTDPGCALTAVCSMLRRAENNPAAFMARAEHAEERAAAPADDLAALAARMYGKRKPAA